MLVGNRNNGRLVEVVRQNTGEVRAQIVLELAPDYSGVDGLNSAGDQLYVTGADNRTLVYSLTTGRKLWQVFGYLAALDAASQRAAIVNRDDEAVVYDRRGKELSHVRSGEPIRFVAFGVSGTTLRMLTADQTVRTVDIPADL